MAKRLVIEGASIVTLDSQLGDFREGDILIEDDRVVAVGPSLGVSDAEVIDGRGQIAIPGFANTHLHTWQHALRGVCADWTVKDYVRCWRIHLGPMYRPHDMYVGNYAGALDALNAGVTLVVDYCHNVVTRDHAREALRGLRDAGVRALFGLAYTPVLPSWGYNGSARRYWDFLYGGKYPRIERQLHHYGSGLNAIPLLAEYRLHPNDLYLLRAGYGGVMGPLANIDQKGFASAACHSFPDRISYVR